MFHGILALLMAVAPAASDTDAAIAPPSQVMAVPPELRARVRREVLDGSPSLHTRLNRLLHLVFDTDGLGLVYQDDANESVAGSYASHTANCLSFTMMFIALAREVGLDAHPQEIRETLGWRQDSGIFYRVDHINAVVRIGRQDYLVDIARDAVIALHAPEPVSDQRLLAHYYNNLAMNDLEQGRLAPALREMRMALGIDPASATNWSNAGVLDLRNGDEPGALEAYTKALALEPRNVSALANMANLAHRQGDDAREEQFRQRLDQEQQSDPFYHFLQAEEDVQAGDYPHAIEHYRHAIRLHADEPRFYAALAQAYRLDGDLRQALRALDRAESLSSGAARDDYRRQLDALRKN